MISSKESIGRLKPYINGRHTGELFEKGARIMKLDSNESTSTPSPHVTGSLIEFVQKSQLNWYPDINSTTLIEKLSKYTGLPTEMIQTFNGSDNALETICKTYLTHGDEVALCMPAYDHFRLYAESCDATLVPVFGPSPFVTKVDALLNAITDKTKIVYIVNPNNPTGLLYNEREIKNILDKAKGQALVIVDEAYFEFCNHSMAHLVPFYSNLIVTRSFSKAFGLAGLRCGYVLTQANNLEAINKIRVGKNINSLAQVAASAALDDVEHMERYVSEVNSARSWLSGKMRNMGLFVHETPANFILLKVANPQGVVDFLAKNNVFVRDRSMIPQLNGFLRITIGHMFIMERFWKVFEKVPAHYLFEQKPANINYN
ncbi:histidinol-phosphate transaminase [bacterium]|nr:histidinol-phosphate transaminase [bacterium]